MKYTLILCLTVLCFVSKAQNSDDAYSEAAKTELREIDSLEKAGEKAIAHDRRFNLWSRHKGDPMTKDEAIKMFQGFDPNSASVTITIGTKTHSYISIRTPAGYTISSEDKNYIFTQGFVEYWVVDSSGMNYPLGKIYATKELGISAIRVDSVIGEDYSTIFAHKLTIRPLVETLYICAYNSNLPYTRFLDLKRGYSFTPFSEMQH